MSIDTFSIFVLLSIISISVIGAIVAIWRRPSEGRISKLFDMVDETRDKLHDLEDEYQGYKREVSIEIAETRGELAKSKAVIRELSYDLAEMGSGIVRLIEQIRSAQMEPVWSLPIRLEVKHKQIHQHGPPPTRPKPVDLGRMINERFSEDELILLLDTLGIDYEGLPGQGKWRKVRELIKQVEREGNLPELLGELRLARPHFEWPEMPS